MINEKLKELSDKICDSIFFEPNEWKIRRHGRAGASLERDTITISLKSGCIHIEGDDVPFWPDRVKSANFYKCLKNFQDTMTERYENQQTQERLKYLNNAIKAL